MNNKLIVLLAAGVLALSACQKTEAPADAAAAPAADAAAAPAADAAAAPAAAPAAAH